MTLTLPATWLPIFPSSHTWSDTWAVASLQRLHM
ncbi:MAG: hypothetical protein CAF43_012280 [Nitrospira sp. CG24C]|nr:MAG: hypothetical protein CAF43_012280 [Nitrospira sp. CG24C]TKB55282.1 MAG: hypothetical protein E8D50_03480 [Nitrospira sp.]